MFSLSRKTALCFCSFVFSLAPSACVLGSTENNDVAEAPVHKEIMGETTQSLTGAHKVCSAVSPGYSRDSIVVTSWHPYTCSGWATSVGAPVWQLGCLTDYGYSWGSAYGGIPSPNCEWAY